MTFVVTLRTSRTGTANGLHEFLTRVFTLLVTGHQTSLMLADAGDIIYVGLLALRWRPAIFLRHSDAQPIQEDGL